MSDEAGDLRKAARSTADALRAEAAVARVQAEASRERAEKLRAVAAANRHEAELAPDHPDAAFRRRYAELAAQHAGIFDREGANQEAEAGRAEAEASSADRRAGVNASADVAGGADRPAR
jgi:hypothetical protein